MKLDKMLDEYLPKIENGIKANTPYVEYATCKVCGYSYNKNLLENGICLQCLKNISDTEKKIKQELEQKTSLLKLYIPKRYIDYSFDSYQITDKNRGIFQSVKQYAESNKVIENGCNLVLSGSIGTGKTMLAICVLRERYFSGDDICYTTITKLIAESRHSLSYGGDIRAMNKYYKTDHLVIDEIGRQSGSENELNIIFEVLNERYNNVLPTILITNKTAKEMQQYLGKAIIDRMNEVKTMFLDMTWGSYR